MSGVNGDVFGVFAAQALDTAVMAYARGSVAPKEDVPPIGSDAVAALDRALVSTEEGKSIGSNARGEALRDLQIAAVAFTMQMARLAAMSNIHRQHERFDQLEEKLVEMLQRQGPISHISRVHDDIETARKLADSALAYAQQIIIAEHSNAPIGSEPVALRLSNLHVAAVMFTMQMAISKAHAEPNSLRYLKKKLIAQFEHQGTL